MGAGAKCGNFRLDGREILLRHGAGLFHTGLRKFGAILGDGTKLGCNVVTNPGTLLKKNSFVLPNTTIGGIHLEEANAI